MKQFTKYIILLAIACSCSESTTKEPTSDDHSISVSENHAEQNNENTEAEADIIIDDNSVILDGIYATSTALPFKSFHVHHIFDGDTKSFWKTIPGAGIEEGIMIYFQEPTYVSKIDLLMASGENLGKVMSYEVYADGNTYYGGQNIGREISNLYVRIGTIKESKTLRRDEGIGTWKQVMQPKDLSVGIAELRLLDENGEALPVVVPKIISGLITASSTLKPAVTYGVANLMDSRLDFGWAEGSNGNGQGESLKIDLKGETPIEGFKIWNGYQRSQSHFNSNARVKQMKLTGGSWTESFNTIDDLGGYFHPFSSAQKLSSLTFEVEEAINGASYSDLVISELRLYTTDKRPIVIEDQQAEKAIEKLRNTTNPILKQYLDRNIQLSYNESISDKGLDYYRNMNNSFVLRSNNTFVLYQEDNESEEYEDEEGYQSSDERISDGSWELISESDELVKVKIFGKLYVPKQQDEQLYGGTSEKDETRIFKDLLILTKSSIKGNKVMSELKVIE